MSQVNVTQVVVELIVPFTEGNTTTPGVQTTRFDAGEGSDYYLVAPITDSASELRSKTIKAAHATGRFTDASLMIYSYDVEAGINMDDLESGDNSTSGPVPITDSTMVAQSARATLNIPNACLHTIRIEGSDVGQSVRDEIHEIVYEVAIAGVRR